jgi:Na+/H+ antiporter NhaD/arsenite permease-like protein
MPADESELSAEPDEQARPTRSVAVERLRSVAGDRNFSYYLLGVLGTPLMLSLIGLSLRQTLAVGCFSTILYGAIFFWRQRVAFAAFGVALLLTSGLLGVPELVESAGLEIILFLVAMMAVIGYMEENQFFEYGIERLLLLVGPHPVRLLMTMMVLAAVTGALVGEVTSILFMLAAMINLIGRSHVDRVPFVLMLVFATNVGSSATVVGNPVGVIVALRSGFTFADFLRWATPISIACLLVVIPICLWYWRDDVDGLRHILTSRHGVAHIQRVAREENIPRGGIVRSAWLFGPVVLGLIFHHQLEELLGLERNTMILGVALLGAAAAIALSGREARRLIETRVDWWTLLFFLLLFASVGTLAQQGVTAVIADRLIGLSGGNVPVLSTILAWASGILTAVMDNVLAVATFVPIIEDVGDQGIQTAPLWWSILFGGTLMGNLTLIGSTANIVAVGVVERQHLGEISFGAWLRPGLIVALPTMILANLLLLIQLPLMPKG